MGKWRVILDCSQSYEDLIKKGGYDLVGPKNDAERICKRIPKTRNCGIVKLEVKVWSLNTAAWSDREEDKISYLPELEEINYLPELESFNENYPKTTATAKTSFDAILSRSDNEGLRPLTLAEFLAWAAQHPEVGRDYPVFFVDVRRDPNGGHDIAYIFGDKDRRALAFGEKYRELAGSFRFAVTPNS